MRFNMATVRRVEFLFRKGWKIAKHLNSLEEGKIYTRKLHYSHPMTVDFASDQERKISCNKQIASEKFQVVSANLQLSEEKLLQYPIRRFTGNINIIKEPSHEHDLDILNVLNKLKQASVLGLDVEMTESKRGNLNGCDKRNKKSRVVQIASESDAIVWQLNNFTCLPPSLVSFLKSNILKVGHAISDDVVLLKKEFNVTSRRLFDTLPWAMEMNCKPLGLHALCAIFLGWRISKGLRTSDWSRSELSENQIHYACTDAWASLLVYNEMKRIANENGHTVPLPIESVNDILDTRLVSRRKRRSRLVQNNKARKNFAIMAQTTEKIVE